RVSASSLRASASSSFRLVIPWTTSTVVSPLIVRFRVSSNPWASPGHSPCRVRVAVVRNVRSSRRPCPLSALCATRPGGGAGAWPAGGKAARHRPGRRLEAEARPDIGPQPGLVGLGEEEVVPPSGEDGRADVALAEQGVAGDDAAPDRQDAQQLQGRL